MQPFADAPAQRALEATRERTKSNIRSLGNQRILNASTTELEEQFIEEASVLPLELHDDQMYIRSQDGTKIDVSHDFRRAVFPGRRAEVQGTKVEVAIPFDGDHGLWRIRPSTYGSGGFPNIEVIEKDNEIILTFAFPDDSADPERLRRSIDEEVKSLRDAALNLTNDVARHNASIPSMVKSEQ